MIGSDLLMCYTCGTQFDLPIDQPPTSCRICDDPRQWVPPTGQRWTSLRKEHNRPSSERHTNHIVPLTVNVNSDSSLQTPAPTPETNTFAKPAAWSSVIEPSTTRTTPNLYTIYTLPQFGIGERGILLVTPHGTILWDLIAYLDQSTLDRLKAPPFNGITAIVISHPHYYTNHLDWANELDCPVYMSKEDEMWLNREDHWGRRRFITGSTEVICPGVTAIKVGGHFPGSLVLHWDDKLFLADSIVTQPSALYHINRPQSTISYTYMWSIPNMIPLPPADLVKIWLALKPFDFVQTHGAFLGQDVFDLSVKSRVLESMKIQAQNATGHRKHEIFQVE